MTSRSLRSASRWSAAALVALAAVGCKNGTDPEDRPVVSSINPPQALAGAQVALLGDNFGTDDDAVTVSFGDVEAPVVSITNRRLVTNVPALPSGAVDVVVRVEDLRSSPAPFTVLRPAPAIAALAPDPVRAGATLTITGLELSGASVRVLAADSIPLALVSVTQTQIDATVPFDLPAARHSFRVETDGQLSERVSHTVDVFDVSGTYAVSGTVVLNTCSTGPAVGSPVALTGTVTDTRPTVTVNLGAVGVLQGVLEGSGSFQTSTTGGGTTFDGAFAAVDGDTAGLSGRIEIRLDGLRCRILQDVTGQR